MYLSNLLVLGLVSWTAAVSNAIEERAPAKKHGTTLCYTALANTQGPAKLDTTTSTSVTSCTVTSSSVATITKTSTSTTTATATSFSSTVTGKTVTATTTVTTSDTTKSTTTLTSTVSATTTTSIVSTTTVEAPATFTPVHSSLQGSSYDGAAGGSPAGRRRRRDTRAIVPRYMPSKPKQKRQASSVKLYGQKVECLALQASSSCSTTFIVHSTSTSTVAGPTTTKTVTEVTKTTTYPSATSTKTSTITSYTSTNIITTTVTTTATSTYTTVIATQDVFAACATNNFADVVTIEDYPGDYQNYTITFIKVYEEFGSSPKKGGSGQYSAGSMDNAYDCCVAGVLYPDAPAVWQWHGGSSACYINTVEKAKPATSQEDQLWATVSYIGYPEVVVGNLFYGMVNEISS